MGIVNAAINAPAAAPVATPDAAPPATPAATTATPPAPGGEWYASLAPENLAVVKSKGWDKLPGPAEVLSVALGSYRTLESTFTADKQGRTLVIPKEDATPEEVAAFQVKLGRPEKVDGYKVPDVFKDDAVATGFAKVAFDAGMSAKQFDATMAYVAAQGDALAKANADAFTAAVTTAVGKLRGEWGQGYQRNMDAATKVTQRLGWEPDTIDALAAAHPKGPEAFFRELAQAGQGMLEPKRVDGEPTTTPGNMTPAEATERLRALGSDKEWLAKKNAGNVAAVLEYDTLVANRAGMTLEEYNRAKASGGGLSRTAR